MNSRLIIFITAAIVISVATVIAIIVGVISSQQKGSPSNVWTTKSTKASITNIWTTKSARASITNVWTTKSTRASITNVWTTKSTRASITNIWTTKSTKEASPTSTWIPSTTDITLIGNFAILHRTTSGVSDASICTYLTSILSSAQLRTNNCTILDKRSGSVKVRYKLVIESVVGKDRQYVLKLASSSIAKYSSKTSPFTINQTSISFEDESGLVQKFCYYWSCWSSNTVCINIIGDYQCVCSTGYTGDATDGICTDGYVARYCNSTRKWISKAQICDKFQDCPDDSDESNCVCDFTYQYACKNGRCIYNDWLCDGVNDCPQGDDEMFPQCDECGKSQFRCKKSGKCIPLDKQCDGQSDCLDSSDENQCVSIKTTGSKNNGNGTRLLTVIYKGTPGYKICSDNWNQMWSNRACNLLGFGNATATSLLSLNDSFVTLNTERNSSSNFMASLNTTTCQSQLGVSVSCQIAECGIRTVSPNTVGPYILNGQRAKRGAWPWQVVVYTGYYDTYYKLFDPLYLCGGILINDRWILTAAHCTQIDDYDSKIGYIGKTKPKNIQVLLGTISLIDNPDMIEAYADQVHTHPLYDDVQTDNDVGLIRLSKPVSFTDTVRPICLPAADQDLSRLKVCVNTGFGRSLRNVDSNDLLQAKMNIMPDTECRKINRFYKNSTQICVGTNPTIGDINICSGDSGGPLSCQDSNGSWMVIGVNSYGISSKNYDPTAADRCQISVVARVPALVDWIKTTIAANSI